jgi:hypothetical protein
MKKRGYTASVVQRCEYCSDGLFAHKQTFYLFPCSHGIHSECLLKQTYKNTLLFSDPNSPTPQTNVLQTVKSLEDQIRGLAMRVKDNDKRALAQQEHLQAGMTVIWCRWCVFMLIYHILCSYSELDSIIAADCPLCGTMMIKSLAVPLITAQDAVEAKAWEL